MDSASVRKSMFPSQLVSPFSAEWDYPVTDLFGGHQSACVEYMIYLIFIKSFLVCLKINRIFNVLRAMDYYQAMMYKYAKNKSLEEDYLKDSSSMQTGIVKCLFILKQKYYCFRMKSFLQGQGKNRISSMLRITNECPHNIHPIETNGLWINYTITHRAGI